MNVASAEVARGLRNALPEYASNVAPKTLALICQKAITGEEIRVAPTPRGADLLAIDLLLLVECVKTFLDVLEAVGKGITGGKEIYQFVQEQRKKRGGDFDKVTQRDFDALVEEAKKMSVRI